MALANGNPDVAVDSGGGGVVITLIALGVLYLTARSMWRSVGPFVEIIKAALAAATTFLLVGVLALLLIWSMFVR